MTDIDPQTRPTSAAGSASPQGESAKGDPLATLHHMSMTAGLGSGDYVAINAPSVVSLLLGIASVAVMMARPLVLIPLAGLVLGLISLRQIRNSGGTQSGRALAWVGVLLSLTFVGLWGSWIYWQNRAERAASDEIQIVVDQLSSAVKASDWDKAWGCFSPQFKTRIGDNRPAFQSAMQKLQAIPTGPDTLARLSKIERGAVLFPPTQFFQKPAESNGKVMVSFDGDSRPKELGAQFRRDEGGAWLIDDLPALFQQPREGGAGGGGPGGGAE